MGNLSRRNFVALAGAAGLAAVLPGRLSARVGSATPVEDFTFLFITDTHLEPELNAAQGTDQCFKKARTIKSDFAIQGGDHVFDSLGVGRERASSLFDLYGKTEQDLGMKIYHTICGERGFADRSSLRKEDVRGAVREGVLLVRP
jgi:Icc protein